MSVILTQTDTTVGFLSQNMRELQSIKKRPLNKPFIKVYTTLKNFKNDANRVPNKQKNRVRRLKKTTFVLNNNAFRVAPHKLSSTLLCEPWYYSTSANESSKKFNRLFCESKADIIIENKELLYEGISSSLMKINAQKIKRLR